MRDAIHQARERLREVARALDAQNPSTRDEQLWAFRTIDGVLDMRTRGPTPDDAWRSAIAFYGRDPLASPGSLRWDSQLAMIRENFGEVVQIAVSQVYVAVRREFEGEEPAGPTSQRKD